MTRPLTVWTVDTFPLDLPPDDSLDARGARQRRTMVATTSRKRAAELIGCSEHYLKGYGSSTTSPDLEALARSEPETVLVKLGDTSQRLRVGRLWVRARTQEGLGGLRCYGPIIDPVEHVLDTIGRFNKGYTVIAPQRPVYGTSGRCRCGQDFKANTAPSKGGTADVKRQHRDHVAEVTARYTTTTTEGTA